MTISNAPTINLASPNNVNIASLWDIGFWDVGNWDTTFLAPSPFGLKLSTISPIGGEIQTNTPFQIKSSTISPVGGEVQILKPVIKL